MLAAGRWSSLVVPLRVANHILQGHHADLRRRMSAFTSALLNTEPAIPGLDSSIVISARRMHLTLGVMSLTDRRNSSIAPSRSHDLDGTPPRELETALRILSGLKPKIVDCLSGGELKVALKRVDIMKPDRGSLEKAHVFWTGPPEEGEDVVRLKTVCRTYTMFHYHITYRS